MRVLVTGGSGFIGSHLIESLLDYGHTVKNVDLRAPVSRLAETIQLDIRNQSALQKAMSGFDLVFHLAAESNVDNIHDNPIAAMNTNILGTLSALESARQAGVSRFVLASSIWVYDQICEDVNLSETSKGDIGESNHLYSTSKAAGEMLVQNYWQLYGLPFTILRYGIPYGARMRDELLIPRMIRAAIRCAPLTVYGDGSQSRPFLDVRDLASAHLCVMCEEAVNQKYNVAGSEQISVIDVAKMIKHYTRSKSPLKYVDARPGDVKGGSLSSDKIKRDLGWQQTVQFREGLLETVNWYLGTCRYTCG